jgi:hypothetical protein
VAWTEEKIAGLPVDQLKSLRDNAAKIDADEATKPNAKTAAKQTLDWCDAELTKRTPVKVVPVKKPKVAKVPKAPKAAKAAKVAETAE